MSAHDYKSASRPAPDPLLIEIADYALNYQITSDLAYETAQYCLMDSLACVFQSLDYPECTKLLGPVAVGDRAKIGANSVVIHDVPPDSTVVGNPGHPVRVNGARPEGPDADWAHLPDPVADALKGMAERIGELEEMVAELTGKQPEAGAEVRPLSRGAGNDPAAG